MNVVAGLFVALSVLCAGSAVVVAIYGSLNTGPEPQMTFRMGSLLAQVAIALAIVALCMELPYLVDATK